MQSMALRFFLPALIMILAPATTHAATITRSSFGQTGGSDAVFIRGDLDYSDIATFTDVTAQLPRQTVVFISSPGGNLKAGIEIGRAIRSKGFRTAAPDLCASACALAWLAGSQRFASKSAQIGFHVAYVGGQQKLESGMGNALVGLYVGELGFSDNVVTYITLASPDDMQWLSLRDAALLGIDVDVLDSGTESTFLPESSAPPDNASQPAANADPLATATGLVRNLVEADMSRGQKALTMVRNTYADRLTYYGKSSSFASVYADKQRYFSRWPIRRYDIRNHTLRTSCDERFCLVTGILDWYVENAARNKKASGAASFSYTLEQVAGTMRVVSEEGEVIR